MYESSASSESSSYDPDYSSSSISKFAKDNFPLLLVAFDILLYYLDFRPDSPGMIPDLLYALFWF